MEREVVLRAIEAAAAVEKGVGAHFTDLEK
jgi:hypothetical protein